MSTDAHPFFVAGPHPRTGAELKSLLERSIADAAIQGAVAPGMQQVAGQMRAVLARCEFTMDGADVSLATADLTGLKLSTMIDDGAAQAPDPRQDLSSIPAVTGREDGVLHLLTIRAAPMLVDGIPLTADGELRDIRLQWLETASGEVGLEFPSPTPDRPIRGYLRLSAPKEEALRGLSAFISASIEREGLRVDRLDIDVRSSGPRQVSLAARAKVRKGLLAGKVRVLGSVEIDANLILRLRDLSITSANPVLAVMIGMVRGELERMESEPLDLKDALPPGSRVTQFQVEVDRDISFAIALG